MLHRFRGWAVGVLTAPRERLLLGETLAGIRQGGWPWERLSVFAEPGCQVEKAEGVAVVQRSGRLGPAANWLQSFRELLAQQEADYYLLLADDVRLRPNVRVLLEASIRCPVAIYSLFSSTAMVRGTDRLGWFPPHGHHAYYGSQALVLPRQAARLLLDYLPGHVDTGIDRFLYWQMQQWQLPYLCYNPSLAQHLGDDCSTRGWTADAETRQAANFLDRPILVETEFPTWQ